MYFSIDNIRSCLALFLIYIYICMYNIYLHIYIYRMMYYVLLSLHITSSVIVWVRFPTLLNNVGELWGSMVR